MTAGKLLIKSLSGIRMEGTLVLACLECNFPKHVRGLFLSLLHPLVGACLNDLQSHFVLLFQRLRVPLTNTTPISSILKRKLRSFHCSCRQPPSCQRAMWSLHTVFVTTLSHSINLLFPGCSVSLNRNRMFRRLFCSLKPGSGACG